MGGGAFRRRARRLTALFTGAALTAATLTAVGAVTTTVAAAAAPGPAFDCTSARFFLSQSAGGGTTQLYQLSEGSDGAVTKSLIGAPVSPDYNALAYNPQDNYLYANANKGLIQIDSAGNVTPIAPFVADPNGDGNSPGGVAATFDDSGHYWIGGVDGDTVDEVRVSDAQSINEVHILEGGQPATLGGSDMTFAYGYLWSVQDRGTAVRRIAMDGTSILVPITGFRSTEAQGADWTYGNGNLGTSGNSTGTITQIHLTNPTSANPTAAVVNTVDGPSSGGNDGASCAPNAVPIGITKTAPATTTVGGTVNWTVTVHNFSSTVTSSGFYVTDTLPLNVGSVTAVTGPGSCGTPVPNQTFSCNEGELAPGATVTLRFSGTALGTGGSTITNTATVVANEANSCDPPSQVPGCVTSATVTTRLPSPALQLAKSGPALVDPGDQVTYSMSVTNTGTGPADGYTVSDPLPAGTTFVSASSGCTFAGGTVTCQRTAVLAANSTDPTPITITVAAPGTYETCVDNTATVTAANPGSPTVSSNTVHTCTSTKQQTLVKTALTEDGSTNAPPGSVVHYTLTVTNTGKGVFTAADPAVAFDDMTDVLDDATYNGDADNGAVVNGNQLSWSGPLAAGGQVQIHYSVTVNQPDTGNHRIVNVCSPDCDSTITLVPDLAVTKVASTTVAQPGSVVTYTITATNTGPGDWTSNHPATFTDDLSDVLDDATYNGDVSPGAGVSGSDLAWTGVLASGQAATITYSVTVNQPDTGNRQLINTISRVGNISCPTGGCPPPVITPVRDVVVAKVGSTTVTQPGSAVTYTVTVSNPGTGDWTAAEPATFTDDLSDVLDDATYNGDATNGATVSGTTLSWSGALAAGASLQITYSVTVNNPDAGNRNLVNTITNVNHYQCPPGNCPPPVTIPVRDLVVQKVASSTDTQPGSTVSYTLTVSNPGTGDWTASEPATLTDDLSDVLDDATYNGDATNGATVSGTTLSWAGPLARGASFQITYSVTVNDPDTGNHQLVNTVTHVGPSDCPASNCPPPVITPVRDLHVTKTASRADAAPGTAVSYTITVTNTGTADWTNANPAILTDDLSNVLDDADYNGDAAVTGTSVQPQYAAPVLVWTGPLAAGASFSITYSITVHKPDTGDHNVLNAVAANVGNCRAGSTDPVCVAAPQVPDLNLVKHASTADAAPGTTVTYTITVTNTGTGAWTADEPASLSDDLGGLLDDAAYNNDAAAGTTGLGATVPAPTFANSTLSWSGPLAAGDSFDITYSVTVSNPDIGDHVLQNTVDGVTGNCVSGSLDPSCSVTTQVPDLAIAKTSSSTNALPGSTVDYTITVLNNGTGPWTDAMPASFTDDLSAVLDDATFDGTTTITGASVPATTYAGGVLSWSGPLAAGASFTVTYTVTINNPDLGDHTLNNAVVAPTGNCLPGSGDPNCPAPTTRIPDLHVAKTSSATTAIPGSVVTYTIQVTNSGTGAFTDAQPASLTDSLAAVLDDATYNGDATAGGAAVPAPSYAEPVLSWSGPLAAGDSFTITYSVTIKDPDTGDHLLDNVAVAPYGNCIAGSGDPNCPAPETKIPDEHVEKTVSTVNAAPGSVVTYTITVTNNGTGDWTDAEPAQVSDSLSDVLDDAVYNEDATASLTNLGQTPPAPTYDAPNLAWSGPLAAGDSFTITYSVTIANPDTGDHLLDNVAVTPHGNCIAGSGDPGCPAPTTTIPDLAVKKTASTADAAPGSVVTYTVTVSNPGTGDWTADLPASITDDLGQVLDDATYGNDATLSDPALPAPTYTEPVLAWSGPLPAGGSFTLTYSVTVNNPDAGDHQLVNAIVDPAGNCLDGSADPDCATTTLVPDLNVVKTASTKKTGLRQSVAYTLTITNPGAGDWTDELPGTATDDLSGVLDDATYDGNALASAGAVTVKGTTLTWTGPLPAGGTVTVNYSVTVNDRDEGDHHLVNVVSTPTGNCAVAPSGSAAGFTAADPMPPGCGTTTPVAAYVVVKRSQPASGKAVEDGQRVTYTVTATNTGQADVEPTIRDYLGGVLDDASYNDDLHASAGTVTRSGNRLVWQVPLAIGAEATLTYSVTVHADDSGDHDLANVVTGNGPLATCGAGQSVCETHNPTPSGAGVNGGSANGVSSTGVEHLPGELLGAALLLLLGAGLLILGRRRRRDA